MSVLKTGCAREAAPRWCLIGLVKGSSAVCKIEHYMRQVSDLYRNGGTQPLGYNLDDKDSGYRSALRFWRIQQTSETHLIAKKICLSSLLYSPIPQCRPIS